MWFNVDEAREYLLREGRVFSLRPKKRKRDEKNPNGYQEVLSYGGFGKKGTLFVIPLCKIEDICELRPFVEDSGFSSLEKWLKKAGSSRWLYYIILLDDDFRKFCG